MISSRLRWRLVALFVLLSMQGCGPGPATPTEQAVPTAPVATMTPPASPSQAPAASLGDFPIGSYVNRSAHWYIEFRADGKFEASGIGSGEGERGVFTIAGNEMTLQGDYCGPAVGKYAWRSEGEHLIFESLGDECVDREGVMVNGEWAKRF